MTDLPPTARDPETGEVVERVSTAPVYRTATVPTYVRAIQLIWFLAGLADVLIGLRFLLKLFGASVDSPFVGLLYAITSPLVAPFRGIFPVSGQGAFVFEPAALVALVIYPLIGLGLVSLIRVMARRRPVVA